MSGARIDLAQGLGMLILAAAVCILARSHRKLSDYVARAEF